MNMWVGVTDNRWFEFHRERQPDEVNFWRPGGTHSFQAIDPGAPFLFKLHSPLDFIVGGGFLVRHSNLPLYLAWDIFKEKNGCTTLVEFERYIRQYRENQDRNPIIGCTILAEPFFWPRELWIPVPVDWKKNLVQGRRYNTDDSIGAALWDNVQERLRENNEGITTQLPIVSALKAQYSVGLHKVRLGQGAFRVVVTESYHRRCAMTAERTLPVLEAAHIKPFGDGPNDVSNGICLRSDLHTLFDRGYMTVSPDYRIEVSRRIREEFQNGRDYYALHGRSLVILPDQKTEQPAKEFLDWHNANVFVA